VNGFMMVVWIGQQVSGDMVAKLFGVTSQAQINMDMVSQGLNL
jgi:aspartokinase